MKKVIKKVLCDTDTAECLGEARYGRTPEDSFTEYLYRTKSGKYFVYAKGGCLSRYAGRDEDGKPIEGEDMYLLTNPAAADWIMDNYGPTESYYAALNGLKKEWAKISVAASTKQRIDELCKREDLTVSELISKALDAYRPKNV